MSTKAEASGSKLDFGFWNKILAVTLGYGGLTVLVALELNRATGAYPFLAKLGTAGLGILIVVSGTLGMHVLRARFFDTGQWLAVRRLAVALTGALAVVTSARGSVPLALICTITTGIHFALPKVLHD